MKTNFRASRVSTWMLAAFLSLFAVVSSAGAAGVGDANILIGQLGKEGKAKVGEEVVVMVQLNAGGRRLDTLQVELRWDNSMLELPCSVTDGKFPPTFSNANITVLPDMGSYFPQGLAKLGFMTNHAASLDPRVACDNSRVGLLVMLRPGGRFQPVLGLPNVFPLLKLRMKAKRAGTTQISGTVVELLDDGLLHIRAASPKSGYPIPPKTATIVP